MSSSTQGDSAFFRPIARCLQGIYLRILHVEDDAELSAVVRRGLVADRHAVDTVGDGQCGLNYYESFRYDLVVLEVELPVMSGCELLKHIRRHDQDVPILMLTKITALASKVAMFEGGADYYLTKPFAFAELRARVQALSRRRPATTLRVLRARRLELDCWRQEVKVNGARIHLTSIEYLVLKHLIEHKNTVQSRDRLFDCVWNQDLRGKANNVDVCISRLRAKMGCHRNGPSIETIRGQGYMVRAEERFEP